MSISNSSYVLRTYVSAAVLGILLIPFFSRNSIPKWLGMHPLDPNSTALQYQWYYYPLAELPRAAYLTSLWLNCPIRKMVIIMAPALLGLLWSLNMLVHIEHLEQCMAHNKHLLFALLLLLMKRETRHSYIHPM